MEEDVSGQRERVESEDVMKWDLGEQGVDIDTP